MGSVLSVITSLKLLYASIKRQNRYFEAAQARFRLSPGIPAPEPTVSQWQLPSSPISNHQSAVLPLEVDIVVIGSGITGAAVARTLLGHPKTKSKRVAMLDAREICSGATGRNGGHVKESPYLEWDTLVELWGVETAREIIAFRLSHIDRLMEVAEESGMVHSEMRRVETVDAFFDAEVWMETKAKLQRFQKAYSTTLQWTVYEGEEAQRKFSLPEVRGCIVGPAGALSPYKLVTSLLAKLLSSHENFTVDANNPVTSISSNGSVYELTTPRGTIRARNIVHATNAHAPHHLPGLVQKIIPVRGQMTSLLPVPGTASLPRWHTRSWSFFWDQGFDYLTIRPDGRMMLGGGWAQAGDDGRADMGISTDTENNIYALSHITGLLPTLFQEDVLRGVEVERRWTGNMGYSVDGLPYVGLVPDSISSRKRVEEGGEWVAAGFSGEGMVNAWGCGEALAKILLGEEKTGLPGPMVITEKRVRRGNFMELAEMLL